MYPNDNEPMGLGYLIIHATTARGAIPLEGAQVDIRNQLPEGTVGRGDVIFSAVTGRDGNTRPIPLSAPLRTRSMAPAQNGAPPPYATYLADVRLDGYFSQQYINVPIFDGITAIQAADLIPLPENGRADDRFPDSNRFFESTAPNL